MRARTKWRQIAIYYGIACGVSWTIWAPLVLGRDGLDLLHIAPPPPVIISTGTLGPLLACYLTHRLGTGNWRAVQFLPRHRFRGLWLLLAPMLILLCFFVVFPALISKGPPSAWRWHLSVLGGILVPMFNYNLLGGPLFEEFGWRGFLQSRLQDVLPPWIAAICVGVMWAAWHLPLFLVQGWSSASPVAYPVILMGLSMVMAFGFNASEEAIGAAILMHSAFNSSPRFIGAYLYGGSMREHPTAVWLIAASFLLAGIMLVIITRGRLAASQTTDR